MVKFEFKGESYAEVTFTLKWYEKMQTKWKINHIGLFLVNQRTIWENGHAVFLQTRWGDNISSKWPLFFLAYKTLSQSPSCKSAGHAINV
jgi:hypothetical protein